MSFILIKGSVAHPPVHLFLPLWAEPQQGFHCPGISASHAQRREHRASLLWPCELYTIFPHRCQKQLVHQQPFRKESGKLGKCKCFLNLWAPCWGWYKQGYAALTPILMAGPMRLNHMPPPVWAVPWGRGTAKQRQCPSSTSTHGWPASH